jgi:Xaa-Pro aminopeptidase
MTELTVTFPDELARQIRAAGLLDEVAVEKVFREALRKQAVGELFAALDEIEGLKLPPITEAEVQAEINAARAERRARSRNQHSI